MNGFARWWLRKKYRFAEDEVLFFGLNKAEDYKKYLSRRTYRTLRAQMDNKEWSGIVNNKIISKRYFSSFNIPQPRFYGYLNERHGYCFVGDTLKEEGDLYRFLEKHNLKSFVIKYIGGGRGYYVYIVVNVSFEKKRVNLVDGQELGFKDFYDILKAAKPYHTLEGYLLEELVGLHSEISKVTKGAPSILRIVTLKDQTGNIIVTMAYVRFGKKGQLTDHAINGGIFGRVDRDTGRVTNTFVLESDRPEKSELHTDSQENMKIQIPYWNEAKELACAAASVLPGVNMCGWDVLISRNGPVLIEGNAGPGMALHQVLEGGFFENGIFDQWSTHLGLEKPDWSINSKLGKRFKRLVGRN